MNHLFRKWQGLRSFFRSIKYGIVNLIKYFPVIWNDRQWDFYYIEQLWLKKYERVLCHMEHDINLVSVDHEKYVKSVKLIIAILKRRESSFYTEMMYDDNLQKLMNKEQRMRVYQIEERDWKTLCKLIEKYQQHYWD